MFELTGVLDVEKTNWKGDVVLMDFSCDEVTSRDLSLQQSVIATVFLSVSRTAQSHFAVNT